MHLWEIDHPYYCQEGNYCLRDSHTRHLSWADFRDSMGQANEDLNLLFRWDWEPPTDDDENVVWQGDENYRDGTLKLFYMGQRKAYCSSHHVEVCRADEPAVREFLEKKWAHMQRLWEGIAASGPAQEETQ